MFGTLVASLGIRALVVMATSLLLLVTLVGHKRQWGPARRGLQEYLSPRVRAPLAVLVPLLALAWLHFWSPMRDWLPTFFMEPVDEIAPTEAQAFNLFFPTTILLTVTIVALWSLVRATRSLFGGTIRQ